MSHKQRTRTRRYLANAKEDRKQNRYYIEQGGSERSILDKFRVRKGGKHELAVYRKETASEVPWSELDYYWMQ